MTESASGSPSYYKEIPEIPIEIVSDEEMALFEAALASAARSCSSTPSFPLSSVSIRSPARCFSQIQGNVRSIQSITLLSKRRLSSCNGTDIEDSADLLRIQKKEKIAESLFDRFRKNKKRGLSVTDITSTEWCEKRMEFVLLVGKVKANKAMIAGIARHEKLEEEVIKKVKVKLTTPEDRWALKLVNFIGGVNQLLLDGLTRELPLIGLVEGKWMVGVIDEIQMHHTEDATYSMLIDTKTRVRDTLPGEAQRRNGRLQLMCYKKLWDSLVADNFSPRQFYDFFALNPYYTLPETLRQATADLGSSATTLDDVVRYYRNTCGMLTPAHEELVLRYEYQKDHSLLGEERFAYDSEWLRIQIQGCLEFWIGERDAAYPPEDERWKCQYCQYASVCPVNSESGVSPASDDTNKGVATDEVV